MKPNKRKRRIAKHNPPAQALAQARYKPKVKPSGKIYRRKKIKQQGRRGNKEELSSPPDSSQ